MSEHVMRAKVQVTKVEHYQGSQQQVFMNPVSSKPYGPEGECEDNTYARYSPSGEFKLTITNPNLFGKLVPGMKMYVDFIEAES
jgi:hypothetical protein